MADVGDSKWRRAKAELIRKKQKPALTMTLEMNFQLCITYFFLLYPVNLLDRNSQ